MPTAILMHPNIVAGPNGPSTRPPGGGGLQLIHIRQSQMDEACGVHCVFMALIALHLVPRKRIEDVRTSLMSRAIALTWRNARRRWFGGLFVGGIERCLKPLSETLLVQNCRASGKRVVQFAVSELAQEKLVIIGIENASTALYHWVLAVGYSMTLHRDEPRADRLFILDPNRSIWPMSRWNGEIAVQAIARKSRSRMWTDSQGISLPVAIDGAVSIGLRAT